MASLWDSFRDVVVDTGSRLGSAVGTGAIRAKLNTDLMLIDNNIKSRKQKFGCELYDYVSPLSKNQAFYTSDDTLTLTLQPPLITAQREIAALEIKRKRQGELIQQAAAVRANAFRPAETWTDKLANAGKSAALGGNEAKLNTEMALYNGQIMHFKQEFGLNLYKTLEDLEDSKQWLPTDREIRSIYDNCRRDIEKLEKQKLAKQNEIKILMNGGHEEYDPTAGMQQNVPGMTIQTTGPQPSVYAKEASQQTSGQPSMPQPHNMYPVQQQQQQQQQLQQQPYPAPGASQHYNMQHPPPPQHQYQMHQHQQQPQAVLHSNLFAGVVPGAAPLPSPATAPTSDPFATASSSSSATQQPGDPFDAFASAVPQQQQLQHDPFANQFTPPPLMTQPAQTAPTTSAPPQDTYVDPFSGL